LTLTIYQIKMNPEKTKARVHVELEDHPYRGPLERPGLMDPKRLLWQQLLMAVNLGFFNAEGEPKAGKPLEMSMSLLPKGAQDLVYTLTGAPRGV